MEITERKEREKIEIKTRMISRAQVVEINEWEISYYQVPDYWKYVEIRAYQIPIRKIYICNPEITGRRYQCKI